MSAWKNGNTRLVRALDRALPGELPMRLGPGLAQFRMIRVLHGRRKLEEARAITIVDKGLAPDPVPDRKRSVVTVVHLRVLVREVGIIRPSITDKASILVGATERRANPKAHEGGRKTGSVNANASGRKILGEAP